MTSKEPGIGNVAVFDDVRTRDLAADHQQLGFGATLAAQNRALTRAITSLHAAAGGQGLVAPFYFEGTRACVSTYVEALALVRERFWTTTFLSSGFWTNQDARIVQANAGMMRRLRTDGGDVRRLFLLDQSPEQVVQAYREQRVLLAQLGRREELLRLDAEFESLKKNLRALQAEGCALRVVYDAERCAEEMPGGMRWNPRDDELAIYDRFRVDIFSGGRTGKITDVRCFSRAMRRFDAYLEPAERLFEHLWEQGEDLSGFIDRLQVAVDAARNRIGYYSSWLARYDYALSEADEQVKTAEAEATEQVLRAQGRWGRLQRYMDVGTCTGRYLLFLRDAVAPTGRILGLDENPECVLYTLGKIESICPDDPRLSVIRRDFTAPALHLDDAPFDLITCMMSTMSHFDQDRRDDFADELQAVLRRMAGLLDENGLLIFSTWSEAACTDGAFLSIYQDEDRRRLADWTPPARKMAERLARAGFRRHTLMHPDPRLNLWICEP